MIMMMNKDDTKELLSLEKLPSEVGIAVSAAQDKKAEDILILALSAITAFTDYFIIMHGRSNRQLNALCDAIERSLRKERIKPLSIEGQKNAEWILMDYGSFIIHIFIKEKRDYYALERLWADVPRLEIAEPPEPQSSQ
jgi:ribosome-associated protein